MYIYIFNELMHLLPFINNAGALMPFIKRLLIKYQADFFGQSSEAVQETWDVRCGATENPEMKKHEGGGSL